MREACIDRSAAVRVIDSFPIPPLRTPACTSNQLQELQMELAEHELVMNQLKPLDGGRRAFRLVGGVLMERTVGEVVPELTDTAEKVRALVCVWWVSGFVV